MVPVFHSSLDRTMISGQNTGLTVVWE